MQTFYILSFFAGTKMIICLQLNTSLFFTSHTWSKLSICLQFTDSSLNKTNTLLTSVNVSILVDIKASRKLKSFLNGTKTNLYMSWIFFQVRSPNVYSYLQILAIRAWMWSSPNYKNDVSTEYNGTDGVARQKFKMWPLFKRRRQIALVMKTWIVFIRNTCLYSKISAA